jgi:hypothetical protein
MINTRVLDCWVPGARACVTWFFNAAFDLVQFSRAFLNISSYDRMPIFELTGLGTAPNSSAAASES